MVEMWLNLVGVNKQLWYQLQNILCISHTACNCPSTFFERTVKAGLHTLLNVQACIVTSKCPTIAESESFPLQAPF